MLEVSIICLVYKSKQLTAAVYDSIKKYTPKINNGTAEFFFVANDPTEEVIDYLKSENIPHYININDHLEEKELFEFGFGAPEYMRRVYQGYNLGILKAKGQKVVLINSDNFFTKDWLENLLKYSDYKKIVCSTLVEPGQDQFEIFPFAIEKNFGRVLADFKEKQFQEFAEKVSKTGYSSGGAYMPCLFYKDIAVLAGMYPEGNIAGDSFEKVYRYGDEYFYDKLKKFGVEHITAKDSIVYHLKEGEKSEKLKYPKLYKAKINKSIILNQRLVVHPTKLIQYITPEVCHQSIINELARKITVLIINPENEIDVENYLNTVDNFSYKNIETILISEKKEIIKKFANRVQSTLIKNGKINEILPSIFYKMYGEFLLVLNKECQYESGLLEKIQDRNSIYYFGQKNINSVPVVEYIENFIIPKNAIINNISAFVSYFIKNGKSQQIDFIKYPIIYLNEVLELDVAVTYTDSHNILIRVVSKLRKDGLLGFIKVCYGKIFKK